MQIKKKLNNTKLAKIIKNLTEKLLQNQLKSRIL